MRTLIVQLPLSPASPAVAYPHAWADPASFAERLAVQWAQADLLPVAPSQTEVVLMVPAQALSWLQAELPIGLHKQATRVPAALQGLLEERLLADPSSLHLALQPGWQRNAQAWVAACDKAWLSGHLQALEAAGLTVHRIVPEVAPEAANLHILALGDTESGWLWFSHPERGVWGCPVKSAQNLSAWPAWLGHNGGNAPLQAMAEPALATWLGERLGEHSGTHVQLLQPHAHWLEALASDWDLAQFDLQTHTHARRLKSLQKFAHALWTASAWRPARWGLALLLITQLVGLNAWAWKTRTDWQTQRQSMTRILQETFPATTVVVDAPLQMAREVTRLRQGSGQLAPHDLEGLLNALGQALPQGTPAPTQLAFQTGQLQVQGLTLTAVQQQGIEQALQRQGYRWRAEDGGGVVTVSGGQP
jgi:general secretion pathway protein L